MFKKVIIQICAQEGRKERKKEQKTELDPDDKTISVKLMTEYSNV
jgi:hypothetical protein